MMKQNKFFLRLLLMACLPLCTLCMTTSCGGGGDDYDDDINKGVNNGGNNGGGNGGGSEETTPGEQVVGKTFTANGVTFTMMPVDGGTFQMGAPDDDEDAFNGEKPQHTVVLSDFYIGETEVTQALWKAVMGSNPSFNVGDQLPVELVSWNECQEFITNLNVLTGQSRPRQNGSLRHVAATSPRAASTAARTMSVWWLGTRTTAIT